MGRFLRKRPCRSRSPSIDDSLFVGTIDDRYPLVVAKVWRLNSRRRLWHSYVRDTYDDRSRERSINENPARDGNL